MQLLVHDKGLFASEFLRRTSCVLFEIAAILFCICIANIKSTRRLHGSK